MTREEFEQAYADSINPRNVAYFLLSDAEEIADQANLASNQESRKALHDATNARVAAMNALPDSELPAFIEKLTADNKQAVAGLRAQRAERLRQWEERQRQDAPAEPTAASSQHSNSAGTLADLAFTDGLVGDLVEWICATAPVPKPALALCSAVTVIGTLVGQQIAGPTMSGTHLYVVGLARGSSPATSVAQVSTALQIFPRPGGFAPCLTMSRPTRHPAGSLALSSAL
jgi:hypothetical protein